MDVARRLTGPSWTHWLGQDDLGRDILSRLLWGARSSLTVAVLSASLSCVIGTALGVLGGFLRGIVDLLTIRAMDVVMCFPPLLLALLVVTLLGPGAATLIPVLALVYLPGFTRVAYAGVLSVRDQEYVQAQRALGVAPLRIMLRTVLPNIGGPVLVQFSLAMASAVVLESGLSFLGLGVVPPAPSWGLMIAAARSTMAQTPLPLLWAVSCADPDRAVPERAVRHRAGGDRPARRATAPASLAHAGAAARPLPGLRCSPGGA